MAKGERRPSGSKASGGPPSIGHQSEDEPLRAVVVVSQMTPGADAYSTLTGQPAALLPVANVPILFFQLETLLRGGVQECILLVVRDDSTAVQSALSNVASAVQDEKPNRSFSMRGMTITIFEGSDWHSEGDALRELETRDDLRPRQDFVLVSLGAVFSLDLSTLLREHRARRASDKNWLLTTAFRRGVRRDGATRPLCIVFDPDDFQLLKYDDGERADSIKIELASTFGKSRERLCAIADAVDIGVDICGPEIMVEFRENFDFDEIRDYVRGKLDSGDGEVLGNRIYAHFTSAHAPGSGTVVTDFGSALSAQNDFMQRWLYPLVPELELIPGQRCIRHRNSVYKEGSVKVDPSSRLVADTVLGADVEVRAHSYVSKSALGKGVVVGCRVEIRSSILMDGVTVEDDAWIECAVVCKNCVISKGCKIGKGSVLGSGIVLEPGAVIAPGSFLVREDMLEKKREVEDLGSTLLSDVDVNESLSADSQKVDSRGQEVTAREKVCALAPDDVRDSILACTQFAKWVSPEMVAKQSDRCLLRNILEPEDLEEYSDEEVESGVDLQSFPNLADTEGNGVVMSSANTFASEILDTVTRAIREGHDIENSVLEVNSLKLVYDRSFADCAREIFAAILREARSGRSFLEELNRLLQGWSALVVRFAPRETEQSEVLMAVLCFLSESANAAYLKAAPTILKLLYDHEIVPEDAILDWADGNIPGALREAFKACSPFVEWLAEADEEDEEEEDEEEEDEDDDENDHANVRALSAE
ncbi:Translation initiation factor eIF-2B subunit epsilon [Porphyridium purpureum]|uniref:Translation initiation factor eIF2B subunit epsilon n=1 Tax=Porphyridium purpureum TaxID=35688 RepID=A0A5J4YXY4_PORPP|nr:Translation initiation factor eIF-2B subunit epsilon [Porphyridium purpureum]|eukprot:POR8718..scf209_3